MDSEIPLVSVCMITYNHEKYISEAIEGVLMQETDFPIELVIGEDFSTDKTREICQQYQKKYPQKIRLLERETNLGMMPNFVDTLQNCQGKYIALCEGDDYWTDSLKLQKQITFLERNSEFVICHHTVEHFDLVRNTKYVVGQDVRSVTTFEDLASSNHINTLSCVFRNKLFKELPDWYISSPFGDYPLHLLNAQYGKIKNLNDVMASYRIHSQGVYNSQSDEENRFKLITILENCVNTFAPKGQKQFNKQISSHWELILASQFKNKDYSKYIKNYPHILKYIKYYKPRLFAGLTLRYILCFFPFLIPFYRKLISSFKGAKVQT